MATVSEWRELVSPSAWAKGKDSEAVPGVHARVVMKAEENSEEETSTGVGSGAGESRWK